MKRQTIACLLVIGICFSMFPFNAIASTQSIEPIWKVQCENNEIFLLNSETNERIYEAFTLGANGNYEKKDLIEYAAELYEGQLFVEESQTSGSITRPEPRDVTQSTSYYYTKTSNSRINGTRTKISADHVGPATINYVQSTTITHGFSIPASLNFSAMQDKIKIGAGFTWNSSLSTSTSIGGSFSVAAGKKGYLSFTPYLNKTSGTAYSVIRYSNGNTTTTPTLSVSGTSPIKLSDGKADGVYAVVYV